MSWVLYKIFFYFCFTLNNLHAKIDYVYPLILCVLSVEYDPVLNIVCVLSVEYDPVLNIVCVLNVEYDPVLNIVCVLSVKYDPVLNAMNNG